jgi:hypothetical protein
MSKLVSTLCGFALAIVPIPVTTQQPQTPPSVQQATPEKQAPSAQSTPQMPPSDEKVKIYISDRESWEMSGGWGETGHQNENGSGDIASRAASDARPETAEIINIINQHCPELSVTDNKDKANYAVIDAGEDPCRRKQISVISRDNGFAHFSGAKGLEKSVKMACAALSNYASHAQPSKQPVGK